MAELRANLSTMVAAEIPDKRRFWLERDADRFGNVEHVGPEPVASQAAPKALELRALFEQNYESVWRLLRRLGVLHAQLDDAAQEVFWVATRRITDIRPGSEKSFLYGVALRVASNEARRRKTIPASIDADDLGQLIDPKPSPEAQIARREARALLDLVLDRLPVELRTAFVLAELEGMEVREIARLEGLPLGTASSRLRRAREEFEAIAKRLRATLKLQGGRY